MYEVSSDPTVMKPFRHKGPEGFVTVLPYTFSVPFISSQCTGVREEAYSVVMWALTPEMWSQLLFEMGRREGGREGEREGRSCEET